MIQTTWAIPKINLLILFVSYSLKPLNLIIFSSGIDLVFPSTLYKFIVWAAWVWAQSCFGTNLISVLTLCIKHFYSNFIECAWRTSLQANRTLFCKGSFLSVAFANIAFIQLIQFMWFKNSNTIFLKRFTTFRYGFT